jgi:hypothetical protein
MGEPDVFKCEINLTEYAAAQGYRIDNTFPRPLPSLFAAGYFPS